MTDMIPQSDSTETDDSANTKRYDFKTIESKWQKHWSDTRLFEAPATPDPDLEKFYMLVMFAYPSGDIHMGHFRNYIIGDAVARQQMMLGKQVFHPFGWDAFGLPAERAAIQRKLKPSDWTESNIGISRDTLQKVGISFDWSREVVTCRPDYYRWSQWLFLQMYERGLAYLKTGFVNWCPGCMTVLANEQVVQGECERCDSQVIKKELEQWYFKITDYGDRLVDDLDKLPGWPENVKTMQREWVGRSFGAEVEFKVEGVDWDVSIYTTRLDTIFGVTFMTLAPESPYVKQLNIPEATRAAVDAYCQKAMLKTEIERGGDSDEKDGVFSGVCAINPFNGERVQIWIGDYVLAHYGTGAVMAVPGHDSRDHAFAKRYDLEIKQVVEPSDGSMVNVQDEAFTDYGRSVNSGEFSGLESNSAINSMAEFAQEKNFGKKTKKFKLHDWLISRQRYWGTPIPIIHCPDCGQVPVPEDQLPVVLPDVIDYLPKGRSPLADVDEFVKVVCPGCGGEARRDADTMDTFICSSWYHLRYADPNNDHMIFDSEKANAWLPVDKYIGGITHATGHLLYFRFITKMLYDMKLLDFEEPATELFNHGMVKDSAGAVMSKSRGNVVSPIALMEDRGVDVARLAMFFTAPSDKEVLWSDSTVVGVEKFLINKVRQLTDSVVVSPADLKYRFDKCDLDAADWELYVALNQTVKRVSDDYARLQYNTVIAALMELTRDLERSESKNSALKSAVAVAIIKLIAPLAPHIAEELWSELGSNESIFHSKWPVADENALQGSLITIAVQVNGKLRGNIQIDPESASKDEVLADAKLCDRVVAHIKGKQMVKEIYVPGKIVNLVVR